jgi:hypothetical protein
MKRLVLYINIFCDTQEKLDTFEENVDKLKDEGTLGTNWISISKEIIQKYDYFSTRRKIFY